MQVPSCLFLTFGNSVCRFFISLKLWELLGHLLWPDLLGGDQKEEKWYLLEIIDKIKNLQNQNVQI